jgi:multiple sugar transport system substrate-binding protein
MTRWSTTKARLLVAGVVAPALIVMAPCGGGGSGTGAQAPSPAACAPAASGEKVTLTFSSWVPGIDKAVDLWNKDNPDIQVKLKQVASGPNGTYQTYANQIKAGNPDDLGQVEFDSLPAFRVQDGLSNIGACPGVAEAKSKFLDWTWQQTSFGESGAAYAIPQDIGPMALYYRKDLFEKAGIVPPKTWDEYYSAAQKIKAAGGHVTNLDPSAGSFLAAMTWQAGGSWFALDGAQWKVDLTTGKAAQVNDYWQKLLSGKFLTSYPGFSDQYYKAMQTNDIWTVVGAAWTTKLIETDAPSTKGKWAVTQMPQWSPGETASSNWGGSTTAVFKGSKHPAEAAKFAIWLNSSPASLSLNNENGGLYPATVDASAQVPALTKPYPFFGGEVWSEFATAAKNVPPGWVWGPTMVQTYADIGTGVGRATQGQGTIPDGMTEAQKKTVEAMKSQGMEVQG